MSVAVHPDGVIGAAAYRDGSLLLFNVETGTEMDLIRAYEAEENPFIVDYGLAFTPDGSLLAAGGSDRTLRVWDVRDGRFADDPAAVLRLEE
jgi:eukaryotic-like serine/threonine-protein kinase